MVRDGSEYLLLAAELLESVQAKLGRHLPVVSEVDGKCP